MKHVVLIAFLFTSVVDACLASEVGTIDRIGVECSGDGGPAYSQAIGSDQAQACADDSCKACHFCCHWTFSTASEAIGPEVPTLDPASYVFNHVDPFYQRFKIPPRFSI